MSGFTALNVEPEDAFEEEVDDTRELQLEEAFKLYNTALRLHSQGPEYYDDANLAYLELFQSDVFKDPEFASGFLQDQQDDHDTGDTQPPPEDALALLPTNMADPSANSIPQLMFLAYKNRGQFLIDFARRKIQSNAENHSETALMWSECCLKSLQEFAQALERDDSDLDLWKRAAKVADVFSSRRIVRYCLESVLAGDDDASEEGIDLSGLDEAYAAGELGGVINSLDDDLSLVSAPEGRLKQPLLQALQKHNSPLSYLSTEAKPVVSSIAFQKSTVDQEMDYELIASPCSWLGIGQALLRTLDAEDQGTLRLAPGANIKIRLPTSSDPMPIQDSMLVEVANTTSAVQSSAASGLIRQISVDPIVESPEKDDVSMSNAESGSRGPQATSGVVPMRDPALVSSSVDAGELDATKDVHPLPSTSASINLPTRKRSSTVAGHDDTNETRGKSKRLRAKESFTEGAQHDDEVVIENAAYYEDLLQVYKHADQWMFTVTQEIMSKAGVEFADSYDEVRAVFDQNFDANASKIDPSQVHKPWLLPLSDIQQALTSWSDDMNQAFLLGHGSQDIGGNAGLTLFFQHSKVGAQNPSETAELDLEIDLAEFVENVNSDRSNIHDTVILWLQGILCSEGSNRVSSYASHLWSSDLKETIVKLLTSEDERIYTSLQAVAENMKISSQLGIPTPDNRQSRLVFELVQSLFELHLDIYSRITNPSSLVDQPIRLRQYDSLNRWAALASECLPFYKSILDNATDPLADALTLRYVWATTLNATFSDSVEQDHVTICFKELEILMRVADLTIKLPNNAAMPEISAAAAAREMSRLSTLDFFMSVFDNSQSEPIAIIERLEPILEPVTSGFDNDIGIEDADSDRARSQVQKLISFLASGDVSLKLYLWRRLHNAYVSIHYTPKTVSCNLRSIEAIISELETERHRSASDESRIMSLLKWIKDADDLVAKLLSKVLSDSTAFDCVDPKHLQSSISAIAKLSTWLHGFAMYDDSVNVGQSSSVAKSSSFNRAFEKCKDRFREMEVRGWTLLYALLKEATVQLKTDFTRATEDLADYLRAVHNALGMRHYCRLSNKVFLKLVKKELLATTTSHDYSADVFQVLFDLHGLKFDPGNGDLDHGCPPETLDKKTAAQMVEIIMPYVNNRNVKDILKSELKGTIEKIQGALGAVKPTSELSYNKRQISQFLKSPINPKELYRCIKGIGSLSSKPVHSDSVVVAGHGWYFLLGQIALTRFKSIKRINPTPIDDLDIAATFFRHDLEHNCEKWETWYRLAQIYDAKIEEDLVWNVSKINDHRPELATLQRNAIHAYTMAVATAWRNIDDAPITSPKMHDMASKMQDMYADFATRLYASSREPLTMDAFKTDQSIRHFSGRIDQRMYKGPPYEPMRDHAVWNFAAYLLRQKFIPKAKPWTTWYTLGKCVWKLFSNNTPVRQAKQVTVEDVLNPLIWAIEALPVRKDSRSDAGYILEPHFKLASIVHKMVHRKAITPKEGFEWLQVTPYARKINLLDDDKGPDWGQYILAVLKKLGNADKLNWHHRIIARAAHIHYDDDQDIPGALGAQHEFTQQIFTKTMSMQVWKPEHERAGRHYVYTSRYVSFFTTLLDKLNDRSKFDLVLRRVRRKPTEFLDHQKLWEEIASKYVRLLRRHGKIPEAHDKTMFENMTYEEFTKQAAELEKWAHDPDTTSAILDIVRDAVEIKKLNNSLMKGSMCDELIADAYSTMYEAFISQRPPERTIAPPQVDETSAAASLDGAHDAPGQSGQRWNAMLLDNIIGPTQPGSLNYPRPPVILTSNVPMGSTPIGLGLQHAMGPQATVSSTGETIRPQLPNRPGRPKQITKRELIRRADSAILKPPPIKTPTLSKKPIIEINITPSRTGDLDRVEAPPPATVEDVRDGESEVSSRRNSIHDSADDESELSEIDEQARDPGHKPGPMFPGLAGMRKHSPTAKDGSAAKEHDDEDVDMAEGEDRKAGVGRTIYSGAGLGMPDTDLMETESQFEARSADVSLYDTNSQFSDDLVGDRPVWHDAEEGVDDDGEKEDQIAPEIPDSQEKAEK